MWMNKEQVMQFLPHRSPFLFIDSVQEVRLPEALKGKVAPYQPQELIGATCICHFKVDGSVKVLEGHFPGNPILPGVVQVEMMAQAASFMSLKSIDRPITEFKIEVALLGVENAKFRKPIVPEMDLEIHATLSKVRGPFRVYDCEIYHEKELMSQSTVLASLKIEGIKNV